MKRLRLLCCLLVLPSITLAASFDCAKAGTPTEKAICASPVLEQLDQEIALAFKTLLKAQRVDAVEGARDEQRSWLKTRDASPALEVVMRARLAALRDALAALSTPTDDAFDALLSMPTAKPSEGEWDVIAPDDFSPEDEAGLIRYLALQVKRGANVNEYRPLRHLAPPCDSSRSQSDRAMAAGPWCRSAHACPSRWARCASTGGRLPPLERI